MKKAVINKDLFDELIGFLYGCHAASKNDIYEDYAEKLLNDVTYEEETNE